MDKRAIRMSWTNAAAREALDEQERMVKTLARRLRVLAALGDALDEDDLCEESRVMVCDALSAYEGFGIEERTKATTLDNLVAQLEALYADKQDGDSEATNAATIENLVAQVEALYAERQELGLGPTDDAARDRDALESLTAQVEALYADLEAGKDRHGADAPAQSLIDQVESLYADRERLENAFGSSDPAEILAQFAALSQQAPRTRLGRLFG